jgi:hypothetical protein
MIVRVAVMSGRRGAKKRRTRLLWLELHSWRRLFLEPVFNGRKLCSLWVYEGRSSSSGPRFDQPVASVQLVLQKSRLGVASEGGSADG